jgi:hypothetical protein
MTQDNERRRIQAILQIRLDGAEEWDARDFIAQKEAAGEDPWTVAEAPMAAAQVAAIIKAADKLIIDASPGVPPDIARHLAMRRNLYARAVAAGEIATANRILDGIAALEGIARDSKTDKNERKSRLLLAIHDRHRALADDDAGGDKWEEEIEHGPRFEPSRWFGCANDRERMQWTRTLAELEKDGLVTRTRFPGERIVHVALTAAGVRELEERTATNDSEEDPDDRPEDADSSLGTP